METKIESLTIGKVARLAEIGVETMRFYEREGLIESPPRRAPGDRQYPSATVDRVRFIKRAKALGFSLREIKELLSLRAAPRTKCTDIRQRALRKIQDIDEKTDTLRRMRTALAKLVAECEGSRPVTECPILASLSTQKEKP